MKNLRAPKLFSETAHVYAHIFVFYLHSFEQLQHIEYQYIIMHQ